MDYAVAGANRHRDGRALDEILPYEPCLRRLPTGLTAPGGFADANRMQDRLV